jgi:putative endonuclease
MATHLNLGKIGEEYALQYLISKGYKIIEQNWRAGRFELDIIAWHDSKIIFMEVKTRTGIQYGYPEESVDSNKEERIRKASSKYIYEHKHSGEIQFDILAILVNEKQELLEVRHLEDAFFPGL